MSRWRSNKSTDRRGDRRSHELDELLSRARDNENTLRRFQSFELKLMAASGIRECLRLLLSGSQARFGQDATSVVLVDKDQAIQRCLAVPEDGYVETGLPAGLQLVTDQSALARILDGARAPRLGAYVASRHDSLFKVDPAGANTALASVALVPFNRGPELSGCLNLASRDPGRYQAGAATDFLAHLGAVASVSLEAVIARHQLRTLGLTDALTGVSNRRFFDQRLHEENARARREAIPLSLVFIDVDHFKKVNDVGGHALGDQVLCDVAASILSEVRMFDVVSRFGGDEFAVLLIGASRDTAHEIAERIRRAVEATGLAYADAEIPAVTASIGIATVDRSHSLDADNLLKSADRAVYQAKAAGRNQLVMDQDKGRDGSDPDSTLPRFIYQ